MSPKAERSDLLRADEIITWPGLCKKLRDAVTGDLRSPARRVMTLLPQTARDAVGVGAREFPEDKKSELIAGLNEILKRRDFYVAEDFENLPLNDETRALLSRNLGDLSNQEIERLNRLLLEVSFLDEIKNNQIAPYMGPRSFGLEQREFFFGREEEAVELAALITAHAVVLLYSQSGAGKTSLLNAKLIPKLEEEELFNVLPPMRVQGQLPPTFTAGRRTNIFVLNALVSCSRDDPDPSGLGATSFAEFLQGREQITNRYGEPSPTVLIFDQFEELFTFYPERWADRETFFSQLRDALEGNKKKEIPGDPLLRVVFCMREDYIAELDPYLSLLPEQLRTRFRLEHLRGEKALLAVTRPLEKTKRSYARGVSDLLVENLLKLPSQSVTGAQTTGLYVEPVQLQVVCQTIWDAMATNQQVITRKHVEEYGDISQALSAFYERSIRSVAAATGTKEEELRNWFGDTLISSEGTRAPVNMVKDHAGTMPKDVVEKLEAMRLIKGEWKGTNVRWYELAHDRFIEPIRRSNDAWVAQQSRGEQVRLRLEARASKWQQGDPLLEPDELIAAVGLVSSHSASKPLGTLVDASRAGAQRKRVKLLTLVGVGAVAIAVLFAVMAVYAFSQRKAARKAEGIARSRLLAMKAEDQAADPELSVLLGIEALKAAETDEAKEVIRTGLLALSDVTGVLRGHEERINQVTFSNDGRHVLTTSADGTAIIWDAKTSDPTQQLGEDHKQTNYSSFSPDGKLVATAELGSKLVRIWDGDSGALLREFRGHEGSVNQVVFSPDSKYLATASDDTTARIWDVATGEHKKLLGHTEPVREIAFSQDGNHIATEAEDAKARIWDVRTLKSIVLDGLTGPKGAIAFSPDGKLLATEGGPETKSGALKSGDYPVTVWDVNTGRVRFVLHGHSQYIAGVVFSPDGKHILTSSGDYTLRLWDANGTLIKPLTGHTKAISAARFCPNGDLIVTGSADNTARLWDVSSGQIIAVLSGHSGVVNSVAFSADSSTVATASDDKTVRLWPVRRDQAKNYATVLPNHSDSVESVTFSPDGKYFVTTGSDDVFLWEATLNPHPSSSLPAMHGGATDVSFSPDNNFVVTANSEAELQIWSVRKFEEEDSHPDRTFAEPQYGVNSIAFSPNGNFVVTASSEMVARVWDVKTGAKVGELLGHSRKVNSAAFSPDGTIIVTASDDGTVRKWDASSYAFLGTFGEHTGEVNSAQYSPNGNLIVTASTDGVARVWNARTGKLTFLLDRHTDAVNSAFFSLDSKLIVTASDDKTARVWNAETGESIARLRGHDGKILKAVFSPNGQYVVSASEDYTARIYPQEMFAPFSEFLPLIPRRVVRELTAKERKEFLNEGGSR